MSTHLLKPGTYWCSVVSYSDRSGLLGVYGPYISQAAAERQAVWLRDAGVHSDHMWETRPLHLLDVGVNTSEEAAP